MKLKIRAFVVALTLATNLSAQNYVVVDLGTLGGNYQNSYAQSINASGQVVGYSYYYIPYGYAYKYEAFLFSGGVMQDLGISGGAYGINNSGQIVGVLYNDLGASSAFLYSSGVIQHLSNFSGNGYASWINNSGQIVGSGYNTWTNGGNSEHAFLYQNGSIQDLGTLGGYGSIAYGINDNGQVVGADYTNNSHTCAFLYQNGSMQDLGTFGGSSSAAYGINNNGQVVGWFNTTNQSQHAFIYQNGSMQDLGTLATNNPFANSSANGVNNEGQVVGNSDTSLDTHAFLYSGGIMQDLNKLLVNTNSGWVLLSAQAINDSGQIVGYGANPQQQPHAFLLNPAATAPIITTQPQSQTVQVGSSVAFSIVANGWPSPNYQWQFNGQNIANATNETLALNSVTAANSGGYSVVVSNAYGSVTSSIASLHIQGDPANWNPSFVSVTPQSAPADGNTPVTATVTLLDKNYNPLVGKTVQFYAQGSTDPIPAPAHPTDSNGHGLETSTNLADTNSWTAVAIVPAVINGQDVVTNGISDRMRFYRLKQ